MAVLGGQVGSTTVRVKARPPETIEIAPMQAPLVVGGAAQGRSTDPGGRAVFAEDLAQGAGPLAGGDPGMGRGD